MLSAQAVTLVVVGHLGDVRGGGWLTASLLT